MNYKSFGRVILVAFIITLVVALLIGIPTTLFHYFFGSIPAFIVSILITIYFIQMVLKGTFFSKFVVFFMKLFKMEAKNGNE